MTIYMLLEVLILAAVLSGVVLGLTWGLSKKGKADLYSFSPFECGFSSGSEAQLPFSLQFFILTLIFLIFDIEIIVLFPYILLIQASVGTWSLTLYTAFLGFLSLGLFLEWNSMGLTWSKFI